MSIDAIVPGIRGTFQSRKQINEGHSMHSRDCLHTLRKDVWIHMGDLSVRADHGNFHRVGIAIM